MADRLLEALFRASRDPRLHIGEARLAENMAVACEAESNGRGKILGVLAKGRSGKAGAQRAENVANGVELARQRRGRSGRRRLRRRLSLRQQHQGNSQLLAESVLVLIVRSARAGVSGELAELRELGTRTGRAQKEESCREHKRNRCGPQAASKMVRLAGGIVPARQDREVRRSRAPGRRKLRPSIHCGSEASRMRTILSGAVTAPLSSLLPFLILSTTSMPETTSPTTV